MRRDRKDNFSPLVSNHTLSSQQVHPSFMQQQVPSAYNSFLHINNPLHSGHTSLKVLNQTDSEVIYLNQSNAVKQINATSESVKSRQNNRTSELMHPNFFTSVKAKKFLEDSSFSSQPSIHQDGASAYQPQPRALKTMDTNGKRSQSQARAHQTMDRP